MLPTDLYVNIDWWLFVMGFFYTTRRKLSELEKSLILKDHSRNPGKFSVIGPTHYKL